MRLTKKENSALYTVLEDGIAHTTQALDYLNSDGGYFDGKKYDEYTVEEIRRIQDWICYKCGVNK